MYTRVVTRVLLLHVLAQTDPRRARAQAFASLNSKLEVPLGTVSRVEKKKKAPAPERAGVRPSSWSLIGGFRS